jgi:hypothetical protein
VSDFVGINLTKDLACIVVVEMFGSVRLREFVMYTFADGRAFRSVPYFNRWRPEPWEL